MGSRVAFKPCCRFAVMCLEEVLVLKALCCLSAARKAFTKFTVAFIVNALSQDHARLEVLERN